MSSTRIIECCSVKCAVKLRPRLRDFAVKIVYTQRKSGWSECLDVSFFLFCLPCCHILLPLLVLSNHKCDLLYFPPFWKIDVDQFFSNLNRLVSGKTKIQPLLSHYRTGNLSPYAWSRRQRFSRLLSVCLVVVLI